MTEYIQEKQKHYISYGHTYGSLPKHKYRA